MLLSGFRDQECLSHITSSRGSLYIDRMHYAYTQGLFYTSVREEKSEMHRRCSLCEGKGLAWVQTPPSCSVGVLKRNIRGTAWSYGNLCGRTPRRSLDANSCPDITCTARLREKFKRDRLIGIGPTKEWNACKIRQTKASCPKVHRVVR